MTNSASWRLEGDRFGDSFNPRRAISSDDSRIGYIKVLGEAVAADPWVEQWANEQIVSSLGKRLGLPCVDAWAGSVETETGAIVVMTPGRKLSDYAAEGFRTEPLLAGALNRDQFGLMIALDTWVLNVDRGNHNLFIPTEDGVPRVSLIDHGHTLLLPRADKRADPEPDDWEAFVVSETLNNPDITRRCLDSPLRPHVNAEEIKDGARTIASVGDEDMRSITDDVSDDFYCVPRQAITTLLMHRRDALLRFIEEVL